MLRESQPTRSAHPPQGIVSVRVLLGSYARSLLEILSSHQVCSESNKAVRSLQRLCEEIRNISTSWNVSDPQSLVPYIIPYPEPSDLEMFGSMRCLWVVASSEDGSLIVSK